ncbi:TadE/TadG family type IV pilus assembly protein [Arthrobacter sp. MMS24-T111]
MLPSSRDPLATDKPPGTAIKFRIRTRLTELLCRARAPYAGQNPGYADASGLAVEQPRPDREDLQRHTSGHERGSAVVEFTFLALLLMVPLVYFVITVGQVQGGSFAVVGAADQAAKVYVAQSDPVTAQAAAERAVSLALSDFGHEPAQANMTTSCEPADCTAAGSAVTVTVSLSVPLPFLPFAEGLSVTDVRASATQLVGRYR